jgi:hypothetical protein
LMQIPDVERGHGVTGSTGVHVGAGGNVRRHERHPKIRTFE